MGFEGIHKVKGAAGGQMNPSMPGFSGDNTYAATDPSKKEPAHF
jgi:Ca2+-binding EF-hand superfamily protein